MIAGPSSKAVLTPSQTRSRGHLPEAHRVGSLQGGTMARAWGLAIALAVMLSQVPPDGQCTGTVSLIKPKLRLVSVMPCYGRVSN